MPDRETPVSLRWLPGIVGLGLAVAWLLPLSAAWKIAPDLGHAWVAPLLMAYLWWERWGERPSVTATPLRAGWWAFAAGLIGAHAALRVFLTPFPVWPAVLALFTGVFVIAALAAAWLAGGRPALRWIAGPLVLTLAVLPMPTAVDLAIIGPLRELMAAIAAEISNLLGRPAIASGTSVRLAASWVGIDEACGGIRSLQACLLIGLFFGEWHRFSWPRRLGLVLAGAGSAVLGNMARVLFLALRAEGGAQAVESAHDAAGWLAMGASLALTGWLASHWAGYRWPAQRVVARASLSHATPAWRWAAVTVGGFLVVEAATRLWFAQGEVARAEVPRWHARLPETRAGFVRDPLPESAREMLRPDAFTAGHWPAGLDQMAAAYYVEWHRGQTARTAPFQHNPTVCLPFSGCELLEPLDPIRVPWSGGEIEFFAYKFRRLGEPIIVAFTIWDTSRGRLLVPPKVESWADWMSWRWSEVHEAREHQPAQMLAVSLPWESDAAPARMQELLAHLIAPVPGRP